MVHHVFVQILDFGPFISKKISWKERSHGVPGGPSGHQAPCTRYPKRQPIDFCYYFRSGIFCKWQKSQKSRKMANFEGTFPKNGPKILWCRLTWPGQATSESFGTKIMQFHLFKMSLNAPAQTHREKPTPKEGKTPNVGVLPLWVADKCPLERG